MRWLGHAVHFQNSLLNSLLPEQQPADSLERQALIASVHLAAEQRPKVQPYPWGSCAAQLASAVKVVVKGFAPAQMQPLCPYALETAAAPELHLQRVADATAHGDHIKLQHYANMYGGSLTADSYGPAAILDKVQTVALRQPLLHMCEQAATVAKRSETGTRNWHTQSGSTRSDCSGCSGWNWSPLSSP